MAAAGPRALTSTSYAILGLLSLRPWTTYELAQQMERALGRFWPRAESKLYEEPKKLVAHGLAEAEAEAVGRRPRTRYSITPAGRRALRAWIPTPGAGPVVEFEGLIKVFFAEHGTKADLLATLTRTDEWLDAFYASAAGISQAYLAGEGGFPERLPWLILTGQFLEEIAEAVQRWVDWATEVVDGWPEDLRGAEPDWATLEAMAARDEAYLPRARPREPQTGRA
jgi:PadR family transcriptional regulator, regulatory protein AphA